MSLQLDLAFWLGLVGVPDPDRLVRRARRYLGPGRVPCDCLVTAQVRSVMRLCEFEQLKSPTCTLEKGARADRRMAVFSGLRRVPETGLSRSACAA
jgi:hypothetical protein